VERLEVERRALSDTGLVTQLQPVPLTDLVRGRLSGPAEVAVELVAQDSFGHAGVRREELPRPAIVPIAAAGRCRRGQVTVDANVEHHPGGSQRLLVKRAETVGRAVEISKFHHEPLGVERPALGVAAHERPDTPPPVEYVAAVQSLCDLQMMTWDTFVVDSRAFLPRREPGLTPRHRPPHATGTRGQVCSRMRVVDAALFGRSDQALQATDRPGNVVVEVGLSDLVDRGPRASGHHGGDASRPEQEGRSAK
jgi:hypothetical protein